MSRPHSCHTQMSRDNGIYSRGKLEDPQNSRKRVDSPRRLTTANEVARFKNDGVVCEATVKSVRIDLSMGRQSSLRWGKELKHDFDDHEMW